jgi:hypothetical protein
MKELFDDKALQEFCAAECNGAVGEDRPMDRDDTTLQELRDAQNLEVLMKVIHRATYGQYMMCDEAISTFRNLIRCLNAEIEEAQKAIAKSEEGTTKWLYDKWAMTDEY